MSLREYRVGFINDGCKLDSEEKDRPFKYLYTLKKIHCEIFFMGTFSDRKFILIKKIYFHQKNTIIIIF